MSLSVCLSLCLSVSLSLFVCVCVCMCVLGHLSSCDLWLFFGSLGINTGLLLWIHLVSVCPFLPWSTYTHTHKHTHIHTQTHVRTHMQYTHLHTHSGSHVAIWPHITQPGSPLWSLHLPPAKNVNAQLVVLLWIPTSSNLFHDCFIYFKAGARK